MKTIVPNYYKSFHCIADKCKHNCCIGWQIDVDEESYEFYKNCTGPFGEKLQANIVENREDESAPAHFKLAENERCPFLSSCNLCEIMTNLGYEACCSICKEHPRFYNFWTDKTEIGLGLACEEAARIILSYKDRVELEIIEDDRENEEVFEDEQELFDLRNQLISILQDRSKPTDERILEMLKHCHYDCSSIQYEDGPIDDIACEQLAVYLLYRNYADVLYDDRLEDRIRFVAESYCTIRNQWALAKSTSIEDLVEPAREFSQKIEYDTDTWGIEA